MNMSHKYKVSHCKHVALEDGLASWSLNPLCNQATFILKHITNPKMKRLLNAVSPGEPSAKCAACGTARLELVIDTRTTTLGQLIDKARSLDPALPPFSSA